MPKTTTVPTTGAGATRRDAELARGREIAQQQDARARRVGGVVEPTDDAPDLASLFDVQGAAPKRSTQERSSSGVFLGGLGATVAAGLALGLKDRSATLRAEPA